MDRGGGRVETAGAQSTIPDPVLSAALLVAGYLLGSIPTGVVLAHRAGVDVRAEGSGNVGATNVVRTAGWRLGAATLAADVLKGAAAVWLAQSLGAGSAVVAGAGLAAVVGHLYPVFGALRGGKGVATTLGVLVALAPDVALGVVAVFVVVVRATRIASAASLGAAAVMPAAIYGFGYPPAVVAVGVLMAGLIFWRHRENIARLRDGTEPRFR